MSSVCVCVCCTPVTNTRQTYSPAPRSCRYTHTTHIFTIPYYIPYQIHANTYVHCCVCNQHIAVRRQRCRRRRCRRRQRQRIGHRERLTVSQPLQCWRRQPAGRSATDFDATADLNSNRLRLDGELFSNVCARVFMMVTMMLEMMMLWICAVRIKGPEYQS